MKLNEAIQVLGDCEQRLRKLLADAAGEGDYVSVQQIAALAKAIAAMTSEGRASQAGSDAFLATAPLAHRTTTGGARMASLVTETGVPKSRGRAIASTYPRFFRRGDELIKVGWSKKDRREYSHRAPRQVLDAVAAALRTVGAKGKLFNGDALLPLQDPTDGSPIPDYQGYVALAWLKHLGVVEQRGLRAGYTLASDKPIDGTITAAWPELAEWRG